MGDLEAYAPPEQSETVRRIFEWHKKDGDAEPRRGYLGASILGTECERSLWYYFRWCSQPDFSGRLYRLFETGDQEEPRMVRDLRAIGCTVHEVDPDTGEQFAISGVGGHFSGHTDGVGLGIPEAPKTWHLLEFKTHNGKSFKSVKKNGVKADKPLHYAQMMVYMGKMGLKRALYLAKNKDTDDLYAERIRYDANEFAKYMAKAERIIRAQMPPERITDRPDSFLCRFCDAKELCWNTSSAAAVPIPSVSCRSCCHATPEVDEDSNEGRWSCARLKLDLTMHEQEKACDQHLMIPGLVGFAAPVDAGDDWIEFKNHVDKALWRHGCRKDEWSSVDLVDTLGPLAGEKKPHRERFGPDATGIFERYPPEDSRLIYEGSDDDELIQAHLEKLMPDCEGQSVPYPITNRGEDAEKRWFEFDNKWLLVCCPELGAAAIFEGVE